MKKMRKKIQKSCFYLLCMLLVQACFIQNSQIEAAQIMNKECLSPYLQIELPSLREGFFRSSVDLKDFDLTPTVETPVKTLSENQKFAVEQKKALVKNIRQEIKNPGTVSLPKTMVMSDFHGEINLFLSYVADGISRHINQKVTLEHKVFPVKSIAQQLSEQGVDIAEIKGLKMFLLGDYSDRGDYGIKCYRAAEELKNIGLAQTVTGNHDLWQMMASMGFHLPIYEGYNFYGHKKSERLVLKHKDDWQIERDPFGWWSQKLAGYVFSARKVQGEYLVIDEVRHDIKDIREEVKEFFLESEGFTPQEEALLGDLAGYFFGTTNVATGFNAAGMMSVQWWEKRLQQVNKIKAEAARNVIKGAVPHQLSMWRKISKYVEAASELSQARLKKAVEEDGFWWFKVFNDIMDQTYASPEWWALDWIFHKGWGSSVLEELNKLETDAQMHWDELNFLHNKHVQDFAEFSRKNFTLFLNDEYGNYFTHGWLPVDENTGDISFTYKGVLYKNKDVWKGLARIQEDVRNPSASISDLHEALNLVNSWYADVTTRIKPIHLKVYIEKFGIRAIQEKLGANVWVTCHNPLNSLQKKAGFGFQLKQDDYVHFSIDKGMSWKKFKDIGGYVTFDAQGVMMRGFEDATFQKIIDNPDTVNLELNEKEGWTVKRSWENEPLAKEEFFNIVLRKLQIEINDLLGLESVFISPDKENNIIELLGLIKQAI